MQLGANPPIPDSIDENYIWYARGVPVCFVQLDKSSYNLRLEQLFLNFRRSSSTARRVCLKFMPSAVRELIRGSTATPVLVYTWYGAQVERFV